MSDSLPSRTSQVEVTNFPTSSPVSGTVTANQGTAGASAWPVADASAEATLALIKAKTDNLDVALSTRTKPGDTQTVAGTVAVSGTVPVSGTFFQGTQPVSATQLPSALGAKTTANSMAVNIASDQTVPVSGTFYQATQPVSGSVSVSNFPATQPVSGTVAVSGTVTVSGALTDTQLRASAVPVSGTFYQATQPVSAAALPLPAGAALEAGNLASILAALVSILANQTNGTELVYDSAAAGAQARLQECAMAQRSLQLQALRSQSIESGGFVPLPELPAFLGG